MRVMRSYEFIVYVHRVEQQPKTLGISFDIIFLVVDKFSHSAADLAVNFESV